MKKLRFNDFEAFSPREPKKRAQLRTGEGKFRTDK